MTAPVMPPSDDENAPAQSERSKGVRIERRQELEHRLRSSPTDLDGYLELANIYRAEDRPVEAKRILEQAKKVFPEEENILWEYEEAVLARSLQQLREIADLDKRLRTNETERELRRSQSDWAARRIQVCKGRLKRHPKMTHLRLVMAEALLDAEDFDEVLTAVEPLLEDDELSAQGHWLKARCLVYLGREVEAMVSLRAASIRRAVPPPLKIKVPALRMLCETAERLGLDLTLERYREHLERAEEQLAKENESQNADT